MTFHIIWTIALLVTFLGIIAWAWSSRRKQDFDEAANLPLEDDSTQSVPVEPNQARTGD